MSQFTRRAVVSSIPAAFGLYAQSPLFYDVRTFGASGDAAAKSSDAIQKAIDAAAERGGGTVFVPAGRYLCATIRLKSRVSLWLDNGCTLLMSPNNADFAPAGRPSSNPNAGRATAFFRTGLLVGEDVQDVAIFGQGVIDGNRTRSGGPKPMSFRCCRRLSIRGVTIQNAASYNISLLGCDYVDIDGVTIRNGYSDGIDPDCCKFVRISNCFVESVNDAICLKASTALGERVSTEHVTVTNCVLRTASIHLKCGTESFGDFRNVAFSNCVLVGGMGGRHGNPGVALYTVDGGMLQGIAVSNITMQNVGVPIALRLGARGRGQNKPAPGVLEDISFSNITASGAQRPSPICGLPGVPVRKVSVSDLRISVVRAAMGPDALDKVPEKPADYPDPTMFGELPSYGLYLRHVRDITLRGVSLEGPAADRRPAFVADDVQGLDLISFKSPAPVNSPSVWLNNVQSGSVLDFGVPPDAARYFRISGSRTRQLWFRGASGWDLKRHLERRPEVEAKAIRQL